MDSKTRRVKEAYDRFKYYRNTFYGTYIYNSYDEDLEVILNFVDSKLEELEDADE